MTGEITTTMIRKCYEHLNKAIFNEKYMADNYMRAYNPETPYQVYPCPAFSNNPEAGHYHIRNKVKRYRKQKLKRKAKRSNDD